MRKVKFVLTAIKNGDGTMSLNGKPADPQHTGRFSAEIPEEETEAQQMFEGAKNKEFFITLENVEGEKKTDEASSEEGVEFTIEDAQQETTHAYIAEEKQMNIEIPGPTSPQNEGEINSTEEHF